MTITTRLSRPTRALSPQRQRLVLILSLVTVITEMADKMGFLHPIVIGRYPLSASLVPCIPLAFVLGRYLFGRPRDPHAEVIFWAAGLFGLAACASEYVRLGWGHDAVALLAAAFNEELVFRLAVPAVVAAILIAGKVAAPRARVIGYVIAGIWFVLLPGHRAQITRPADALPFLAFTLLASIVVYRSGSVMAVVVVHACTDLLNVLGLTHHIGQAPRALSLGCLFVLMMVAYGFRYAKPAPTLLPDVGRPLTPEPGVIDLRDHVLAEQRRLEAEAAAEDERLRRAEQPAGVSAGDQHQPGHHPPD